MELHVAMYRMEVELEEKLRNTFRKMKGNPVASLYVQVLDSWGYYECNGDSFFFNLQKNGLICKTGVVCSLLMMTHTTSSQWKPVA